jgi:hypothetical protein
MKGKPMAKLTYWVSECLTDSHVYSIIAKTKKGVQAQLDERKEEDCWGPIEKAVINYSDAFDLFDQATGEGGGRYFAGYRG